MPDKTAIHSPNWLGDAIMFLPAWKAWRASNPGARVAIVAKRRVSALWELVAGVDRLIVLDDGPDGMARAEGELREFGADSAFCAPQSLRSAWLLRRAGIRRIRGTIGQLRFLIVRDPVSLRGLEASHQSLEYARIMGVDGIALPPPCDALDSSLLPDMSHAVPPAPILAVLPGAARGGSKRWPPSLFAETAASAVRNGLFASVAVCGTSGERMECDEVSSRLASMGVICANLCAKTSLPELAAVLAESKAALSNDSGGMHLATAVGTPVVAVFGLTDSAKTGPLGKSIAVSAEGVRHCRAIPRESSAAEAALRSVTPERVLDAIAHLLST